MNITAMCMGVVGVVLIGTAVRKISPDWSPLVSVCLGLLVLRGGVEFIYPAVVYVQELLDTSQYSSYLAPALKALGVATVTHITCETCRDLNENSVSAKVELCGKAAILLCGIPVIKEIFSTVNSFLQ